MENLQFKKQPFFITLSSILLIVILVFIISIKNTRKEYYERGFSLGDATGYNRGHNEGDSSGFNRGLTLSILTSKR